MNYDLGYLPHCEGAWNDNTAYDPMAIVTNYGVAYISKVAVSAGAYEPGEAAGWGNYWQILTEGVQGTTGNRGPQGAQGATGARGAQGATGPAGTGISVKKMSAGGSDRCKVEMKSNEFFDLKKTDSMTTLNIAWNANEQFLSNPGQVRFVAVKDVNLVVSIEGGEVGKLVYRTGVEGFENGTFKQGYTYVVTILGDMIDIESFKAVS